MRRVIIFADVDGSSKLREQFGDLVANKSIFERLQAIEVSLRAIDPTITRTESMQGDSILLTGTDLMAILHNCVVLQAVWGAWPVGGTPVKIVISIGEFEMMPDGQFKSVMGGSIDLAKAISEFCPAGETIVSESALPEIRSAGFAYKLIKITEFLHKYDRAETFYEVDGSYIIPKGDRQRAVTVGAIPTPSRDALPKPAVIDVGLPGAIPGTQPRQSIAHNGFWKRAAIVALVVSIVALLISAYVVFVGFPMRTP